MKFKERYSGEDQNLSLGRFYNTDIRKLAAIQMDYPRLFSDDVGDPRIYFTARVQAEDSVFFALRYQKDVIGYGAFDPIGNGLATMQAWKKKRWERISRHHLVGLVRLLAQFGFEELGFRRVTMTATSFATAAINLVRDSGFTEEGRLRKFGMYDGIPTDILLFGMLKEEF